MKGKIIMSSDNLKDTDLKTNNKSVKLLKEKSLSVTLPRKIILSLLISEHGPFTAEEIFTKLPLNTCDQATIYRCLNQFVETELVTITYLKKDTAHFEYNDLTHHHHHIVCKICKKIDSFHECILNKMEATLLNKGYKDIQHRLEFFGICHSCQES